MKEVIKIAVGGGKGGVGKSMVASSLAYFFSASGKSVVAVDCDADTPNMHLWLGLKGGWAEKEKISVSKKAVFLPKSGTNYKEYESCAKKCPFGAMEIKNKKLEVNKFLCEGCGSCLDFCPKGTIKLKDVKNGEIRIMKTKFGFPLVSGSLYSGESGSGKIVSEVKTRADMVAEKKKAKKVFEIIDSPPGTGCPVSASFRDARFAVLVVEPSVSSLSDLKKSISVADHFSVKWFLTINKWDINKRNSRKIESQFRGKIIGKISYDKKIVEAISNLRPIFKTSLPAKKELFSVYENLEKKIS